MKTTLSALLLLLISVGNAGASGKTVTFFSDGAMVEIIGTAVKGVAEIPLSGDMAEGTLRITPMKGTEIRRVAILPVRLEEKRIKELELLREQKSRQEDRLQALATREDIFKAAAKSQSGKAPRKTKANPDPLQSIRQGTDFAIAQLEAVYTAKRRSEQEIKRLESRILALRKGTIGTESIARVTLSSATGKVKARYALTGRGWTPVYELRLNSTGFADLGLYGSITDSPSGAHIAASADRLGDGAATAAVPVAAGAGIASLAHYRLPVRETRFDEGFRTGFSCTLTNTGSSYLPPGTAALYRNGEYRGQVRFDGISSGRSRKISSP